MKNINCLLAAICVGSLFIPAVSAQEQSEVVVPLPSVDDFSQGQDGWSFGLGLAIEYETAYEGSDEFEFEAQPAGGVQWRSGNTTFFFAGEALGWRGRPADAWFLQAVVGFDEGREEGDSDEGYLNGLGDQDEGAEVVFEARRTFATDWRYWLVSRVVAGSDGNLGLFGVGRRFGEQNDGSGSEVNLVAVFHDSDYANKGFGINSQQAMASGYNEYELSSGLRSYGINYNYRYYLDENWQIFGEALYEYFSSDVRDSPIARSDYEAEIGIGFIYVF